MGISAGIIDTATSTTVFHFNNKKLCFIEKPGKQMAALQVSKGNINET